MSLHAIARSRFYEWETSVRGFIREAEKGHQYGWAEAGKVELLYGIHLWEELNDPDVDDRERMMLLDDLRSRTGRHLQAVMDNPKLRGIG